MSRYAYDYSLSPARPTGWRATLTSITVVGTVMAISAISGALVTLQLFAAPAQDVAVPRRVAAAFAVVPAPQPVAPQVIALATKAASAPTIAATNHVAPPITTAAVPTAQRVPPAPPAATAAEPAPVVAQQSAPIADSQLTFAAGYAQRQAVANGTAAAPHGKILVAAQTQLGRTALKVKPKTYARNNAQDRRRVETARSDAYGMFQRFERPDQFDFARHQALAFGEQRTAARRHTEAPRNAPRSSGPYGNSPNGMFGGLF